MFLCSVLLLLSHLPQFISFIILICYAASYYGGYTAVAICEMVFTGVIFVIFMMELDKQIQLVNWLWTVSSPHSLTGGACAKLHDASSPASLFCAGFSSGYYWCCHLHYHFSYLCHWGIPGRSENRRRGQWSLKCIMKLHSEVLLFIFKALTTSYWYSLLPSMFVPVAGVDVLKPRASLSNVLITTNTHTHTQERCVHQPSSL